jgi:hypothetical protein
MKATLLPLCFLAVPWGTLIGSKTCWSKDPQPVKVTAQDLTTVQGILRLMQAEESRLIFFDEPIGKLVAVEFSFRNNPHKPASTVRLDLHRDDHIFSPKLDWDMKKVLKARVIEVTVTPGPDK